MITKLTAKNLVEGMIVFLNVENLLRNPEQIWRTVQNDELNYSAPRPFLVLWCTSNYCVFAPLTKQWREGREWVNRNSLLNDPKNLIGCHRELFVRCDSSWNPIETIPTQRLRKLQELCADKRSEWTDKLQTRELWELMEELLPPQPGKAA